MIIDALKRIKAKPVTHISQVRVLKTQIFGVLRRTYGPGCRQKDAVDRITRIPIDHRDFLEWNALPWFGMFVKSPYQRPSDLPPEYQRDPSWFDRCAY